MRNTLSWHEELNLVERREGGTLIQEGSQSKQILRNLQVKDRWDHEFSPKNWERVKQSAC